LQSGVTGAKGHEQATNEAGPTGPDMQDRESKIPGEPRCTIKAAPKSYG